MTAEKENKTPSEKKAKSKTSQKTSKAGTKKSEPAKPKPAKKKKRKKFKFEFTKILTVAVLIMCARWIELTYRLAADGKDQIAERLAIAIVTTIIGDLVSYRLQSYGQKNSLNKYQINLEEDYYDEL